MQIIDIKSLLNYIAKGGQPKYLFFWGHKHKDDNVTKACFSQWFESSFKEDGISFKTAEHYMMYQKAVLFGDKDISKKVIVATNPGAAKALGRQIKKFDNDIWLQHRFEIVINANVLKFSQNKELKEFLLKTKDRVLVEASPVDNIWGIGLAADNINSQNPYNWKGPNLLGFALMVVRDKLI
ncbi:MAG: NADAR family protein [Saccharospirillaceae bacterium]|nr:NADAR family protein [Pseudomonadales bacterium]NRB79616.1 NADAR family protein [Saccharospirillaceae bacterium]